MSSPGLGRRCHFGDHGSDHSTEPRSQPTANTSYKSRKTAPRYFKIKPGAHFLKKQKQQHCFGASCALVCSFSVNNTSSDVMIRVPCRLLCSFEYLHFATRRISICFKTFCDNGEQSILVSKNGTRWHFPFMRFSPAGLMKSQQSLML